MQVTIRNTLGVERADITVSPLCLLAGLNGASKTSALTAIGCALTGQTMPGGIAKKDAKVIVKDGTDGGRVTIQGDEGQVSVTWPAAEASTEGRAPWASPIAAGLASVIDMEPKERAKVLAKYLKTEPSKADLAQALRDSDVRFCISGHANTQEADAMKPLGLDPMEGRDTAIFRAIEKVWKEVEVSGFDGAHAQATKRGAELKGAWRQVAGEAYGSDKAAKWQPKDQLLIGETVPEGKDPLAHLDGLVTERKKAVEDALRSAAVAAADLEGLRAKATTLPELEKKQATTKATLDAARDAQRELAKQGVPEVPEAPLSCPHCGCDVMLEDGKLVPVSHAPDPETIAAAQKELEQYRYNERVANATFQTAYDDLQAIEREVADAKTAATRLEALGESGGQVTEADVAKTKESLSQAERALAAVKQKAEADKLHRQVVSNQALIDALAPEGVRKVKLGKVLEAFNEGPLLALSNAAGWKAVTIGPDLEIRYGARLAREPFVSESQVMRAKIVLQLAFAQLDHSACALIDRADKLDPRGRNGLFGLLAAAKVPAVVAMTMGKPELVPDLAAKKFGAAYWLKDGVAMTRAEAVPAPVQQAAE